MKTTLLLAASLLLTCCTPKPASESVQCGASLSTDDVILHAWCWSFNTIRRNLPDIAAAGYTIVQTPPAEHCVTSTADDPEGGPQLYGHGRWYYHYQPIDWQIGNYQVGTADDLAALCAEARRWGIRIIVDVMPNHTAIDHTQVSERLNAAVGGHQNLYHASGFQEIADYNDRLQCTTGQMGGLPDVNTENPDFQHYYLAYVNQLIRCGVRGFRYDTAKHIGLPSDPRDERSPQNDFWLVATGRKSVQGSQLLCPNSLYIYGEVLQDQNVKEVEYADFMNLTASSLGWVLRHELETAAWDTAQFSSYCHPASPSRLVTWVESHDTYCNAHESASLTDQQIALGWVYLTARQWGAPLFYSRPAGSDGPSGNYWGNNLVGERGSDAFLSPLVVAANRFRHQMKDQPESLALSADGAVCIISRGSMGAAVINLSADARPLQLATTLPDGAYADALTQVYYVVSNGMLEGQIPAQSALLLQSAEAVR